MLGFIEVKKLISLYIIATLLAEGTAPTAQASRKEQIVLLRDGAATVPFILTNSRSWSIGVAENSSQGKIVNSSC